LTTKINDSLMQYEVSTPEKYLDVLDEDWRKEKLQFVRELILSNGPDLEEGIEYKMLSYGIGDKKAFHLNAQKGYVSLYVGNIDKINDARSMLEPFDMGKGCIRIKKSIDLKETELEAFISKTLAFWKAGGDIDC
jgi:uncharacterized protein YdhG (YjbR/CyaY superfamily)